MSTKQRGKRSLVVVGLLLLMILALAVWSSWNHIGFWWLFEPLGNNEQGYPEYRHRQTGIVMVRVPGGTFSIGTSQEERERMQEEFEGWREGFYHDLPQHNVTLGPFLIAKYELTQAVWQSVMGNNPSPAPGDDRPVEGVLWNDCQEFCRKSGLSLPTEAQWEYACRAGTSGHFSGTGDIDEMGWHRGNRTSSVRAVHAVGEKKPNDFGLHDMHGNVYEYCEDSVVGRIDTIAEFNKSKPYGDLFWITGNRVIRGGGWNNSAWLCRSASRLSMNPTLPGGGVGLRLVYWPLP